MKKYLFLMLGISAFACQVHSAGFQLWESSTTNLGRSFAGAGVVGDDYSSLAYNPAGMSFNSGSGFQLGAVTTQDILKGIAPSLNLNSFVDDNNGTYVPHDSRAADTLTTGGWSSGYDIP